MSMNDALHLKQTEAFINENPVDVVVTRRTKQANNSGGWKWTNPQNLDPQTMRKVGTTTPVSRETADGKTVLPNAVMIALPDADLQIGDLFTIEGRDHEVVWVDSDHPPWRLRAEVIELVI
jgi:hypothetical protein